MNPLKHMETIFGVITVAALLVAAMPDSDARAAALRDDGIASVPPAPLMRAAGSVAAANQFAAGAMPVVVIKGKRLNAREKRRAALAAVLAVATPVNS